MAHCPLLVASKEAQLEILYKIDLPAELSGLTCPRGFRCLHAGRGYGAAAAHVGPGGDTVRGWIDTSIWDGLLQESVDLLAHVVRPSCLLVWRQNEPLGGRDALPESVRRERYPTTYLFRRRNDMLGYNRGHISEKMIRGRGQFGIGEG